MKRFFTSLWARLLDPPVWVAILTAAVTVISCGGAITLTVIGFDGPVLSVVAYTLFGVAALSLAYSVYLIIRLIPALKRSIVSAMLARPFTARILNSFGFRTVVFSTFSFLASLAFAVFNGYMGIMNRSIWYGALAAYYVALALLRGGILTYYATAKRKSDENSELVKAKIYRNSGIILLLLNAALSSAIAQMIFSGEHFTYVGWTIFAFAAYSFYKITMSVINLVRAHRECDYTVRAIRDVNLTDATVSILALQTALLTTFSDETLNTSIMNTATGIVVSLLSVGLSIFMLVTATRRIKQVKSTTKDTNNNE